MESLAGGKISTRYSRKEREKCNLPLLAGIEQDLPSDRTMEGIMTLNSGKTLGDYL
jgi:hypothetical protein